MTLRHTDSKNTSKKIIKVLYIISGFIFTFLGIIGIILPLLPASPFLLIAAYCFGKSSPKFYNWLLNNKWLGIYIKNYKENTGIPIRVKIISIAILLITICYSAIFVIDFIYGKIILFTIGIGVSVYIFNMKTQKKSEKLDSKINLI